MAYNIENVIKRIVEKNFPSVGDAISYKVNRFSEVNTPAADSLNVDIQQVGDGRQYFMVGFSSWEGDHIVSE